MQWKVGFSEEVRTWYIGLSPSGRAAPDRVLSRLEAQGHLLGMPHSKSLGDGLRELRFTCERVARRVTYVLDPERQEVTLTTFRKQRQNERAEVLRARRAQSAHQTARAAVEDLETKGRKRR
jgi:hypothetical protein